LGEKARIEMGDLSPTTNAGPTSGGVVREKRIFQGGRPSGEKLGKNFPNRQRTTFDEKEGDARGKVSVERRIEKE